MRRAWRVAAGIAYVAGLLLLTLGPLGWWLNRLTVRVYVVLRYDWGLTRPSILPEHVGFVLNVLMFVPLGVVLAVLLRRLTWWGCTLAAVVVSLVIEGAQLVPAVGREASVADVVANGLGGALGAAVVALRVRRVSREPAGS